MDLEVVILAAGLGTRLGRPFPKPLTRLSTGETILRRQVDSVRDVFGADTRITVVVGFKLDLVVEANPDLCFVYNEVFDSTNTSKSLLKALKLTGDSPVLWFNGDVVFDARALLHIGDSLVSGSSFVCVNTASVAEEEVKYTVDDAGNIRELSKTVVGALGEALGINYVARHDKAMLIRWLEECADNDYFERGLELAIENDGMVVQPLDLSAYHCVEVDFEDDLARANAFVAPQSSATPPSPVSHPTA
jgi:choline kinase